MGADQDKLAEAFLLGKLSENERTEVERDFFNRPDVFEGLLIAENSLTDAYVTGRLSREDRRLFESTLLISPMQRQRAAFAETFVRYASQLPVADDVSPKAESTWLKSLQRLFLAGPRLSFSFAAAVLIVVTGAAFWWASSRDSRSPENLAKFERPAASEIQNSVSGPITGAQTPPNPAANRASLTSNRSSVDSRQDKASPVTRREPRPDPAAIISTIVLSLGSTRGNDPAKSFAIPANTKRVNLRLKFDDGDFSSYFAVLETIDGQQIWGGKERPSGVSKEEGAYKTVTMSVPARLLKRGDYIVILKGLTKEGIYEPVGDYSFTIGR